MTATPEQTAAVLRRAADLIEKHGWTQGDYFRDPDGTGRTQYRPGCSMCTVGAIRLAANAGLTVWANDLANSAMDALRHDGIEIPSWNDAEDRTAAEVTAQMRATADRLEKETQP